MRVVPAGISPDLFGLVSARGVGGAVVRKQKNIPTGLPGEHTDRSTGANVSQSIDRSVWIHIGPDGAAFGDPQIG